MQIPFPLTTNLWVFLAFFSIALVLFHIVLVFAAKLGMTLGKKGWKKADYYWLGFTALGLFGASSQARHQVAKNMLPTAASHASWAQDELTHEIGFYAEDPGILCRKFVRSEHSPPLEQFDRVQRQWDDACQWIKRVAKVIPVKKAAVPIDVASLPAAPASAETDGFIRTVKGYVAEYNQALRDRDALRKEAEHSATEATWVVISPVLLALALALRITKVTGELRLDSHSKP